MATLVLSVLGDDRSGLVSRLSGVIASRGGSWERSQMARLAGKFAGIVVVSIPDAEAESLAADLRPLRAEGLLDVVMEFGHDQAESPAAIRLSLALIGGDRPGIVHEVSRALADRGVSIEELSTATREAPMGGGMLFEATATLVTPSDVSTADLREALEALANELMVDLTLLAD